MEGPESACKGRAWVSHAQITVIHAEVLDSRCLALGETTGEKQGCRCPVPDMLAIPPAHEKRRAEPRALLIPVFPCSQSSVASPGKAFISTSIGKHLDCCVTMWRGPACHDVGNPYNNSQSDQTSHPELYRKSLTCRPHGFTIMHSQQPGHIVCQE